MLDGIAAAQILKGVRGADPVNRDALAKMIQNVSQLISDHPEIAEMDLNPVFATKEGAIAADVRIVVNFSPAPARYRPKQEDIVRDMNRIMKPKAVAVIGASSEAGKIGNSVMKNLINGGYKGQIYPINPSADEIMGLKAYKSVKDVPGDIDVAVFAIPAKFVAGAIAECGEKKIPGAVLIPSGFAEIGNVAGQKEIIAVARKYGVRLMGPNIYGFYYTWSNLCATFCTAYDVKGHAALSSQSGGIGMAIIGFSRSAKMGVSAIVGLGNKSDIDEDDLLTFFEQDDNTHIIVQHCEDLKDGRAFAEVAKRVSKKKPVVMLKAGRTALGARAASSHTGALAGNDKIYDDVLRQSGVIRARSLREMLEFARALPHPADAQGRQHRDHHRCRRLRRAAVGRGRGQRPVAHDVSAGPRRGVQEVHSAVRCVRQPGRHHRRRAAEDLPEHRPARARGSADPLAHPRLLAHDRHAADGVREAPGRDRRGNARRRASTSRSSSRWRAMWRSKRRPSISSITRFRPIPIRRRSRWTCSAPSTSGRAVPDCSDVREEDCQGPATYLGHYLIRDLVLETLIRRRARH